MKEFHQEDYEIYQKAQKYFEKRPEARAEEFPQKQPPQPERFWNQKY